MNNDETPMTSGEELMHGPMLEELEAAVGLEQELPAEQPSEAGLSAEMAAELESDDDGDDDTFDLGEPDKPKIDMTVKAMAEAIIFASDKPIKEGDIAPIIQAEDPDVTVADIKTALAELVEEFAERKGGFMLESIKGQGYQFRTVKDAAPLMMNKFASRPRPLSKAAMETLAIVAYRQPVTRADVEHIRGVDAGNIIKNLVERDLIKCTGRKEDTPGKPMQFGTSGEFLRVFRLQSLKELPPLASFQPHKDDMEQASENLENRTLPDEDAAAFIEGDLQGPLLEGQKQLILARDAETVGESGRELEGASVVPMEARDEDDEAFVETLGAEALDVSAAIDVAVVEDTPVEATAEEPTEAAPTQEAAPAADEEPEPAVEAVALEPAASEPEQQAAPEPVRILSDEEANEEFDEDTEVEASAEDEDDDSVFDFDDLLEVEVDDPTADESSPGKTRKPKKK